LEEFRRKKMKRAVDETRAMHAMLGPLWVTYGMLTHSIDPVSDDMQREPDPLGQHPSRDNDADDPDQAGPRPRTIADKARFRNARKLKYISNYFEYVGVLVRSRHVDKSLFFRQLCDVTISNWRVLRPYVYYQRLAIRHRSAAEYIECFSSAAASLHASADDTFRQLSPADQKAAGSPDALMPGRAARHLDVIIGRYRRLGPVSAVGAQLNFEWLFWEALAWRRKEGALVDSEAEELEKKRGGAGVPTDLERRWPKPRGPRAEAAQERRDLALEIANVGPAWPPLV
jgi:hypothetical protein